MSIKLEPVTRETIKEIWEMQVEAFLDILKKYEDYMSLEQKYFAKYCIDMNSRGQHIISLFLIIQKLVRSV